MVPLPPIPPLWVLRGDVVLLPNAEQRRRRLVRVGCLVIGIAGLARQPGVLLPAPDVPEVHPTFQCPAEPLNHTRGPLLRAVVEQPQQRVVELLVLCAGLVERVQQGVAARMP